jgi:hypothetical protein
MIQWLVYRMHTKEMWLNSQQRYEILVCGTMVAHQTGQKLQSLSVRTQIHAVAETILVPHNCQPAHITTVIWQLGWQRNTSLDSSH